MIEVVLMQQKLALIGMSGLTVAFFVWCIVGMRGQSRDIEALTAAVRQCRKELELLKRGTDVRPTAEAPMPAMAPAAASVVPDSRLGDLPARIGELEARVQRIAAGDWQGELKAKAGGSRSETPSSVEIPTLQAMVLDPSRSAQDRAAALEKLRQARGGSRSREIAMTMLQLAETSPDPEVRASILRNLKGAVPVDLKQGVIRRLLGDDDRRVREEAAELLGEHSAEAEVREALQRAATTDSSDKVRQEATKALNGGR